MSKNKETRKEELIKNFANKLISHIHSKSSEAAEEATRQVDGFDSCAGMGSINSEEALRKSIDMMFGLIPYEEKEYLNE